MSGPEGCRTPLAVIPVSNARFPVPLAWRVVSGGKVVWFEYPETAEAPCPTYGWGTALGLQVLGQPKKASRICWAASPAGRVPART